MEISRPTKTLADYIVIALSPVLIMVLVHSVCFFLVEVFYRGEAAGGVRWVLFWFVLAAVLIARIGIEQGDGHAMAYGIVLALASWVYLLHVQPNPVLGAVLLGIVWFTAHKLTCNCTLIDDDVDASGQGLLQSLRKLPKLFKKNAPSDRGETPPPGPPSPRPSGVRGFAIKKTRTSDQAERKKTVSEVPGIWLIYFSLAALPIFGLGEKLLPARDSGARHQALVYLFCYLAGALGLLVTTSFLGLRRYLRQRFLTMPDNIAAGWLRIGVIAAAVVLFAALLFPRPGAGEAWATLRHHVDYQLRRASEYAAKFNPHGSGSGRAGNQAPPNGNQENQPKQPGGQASNPDENKKNGANEQTGEQAGKASDHGNAPGNEGTSRRDKSLPELSPAASSVYPWLKILFWLAVGAGLIWLLYRYRVLVMNILRSVWAAIRNFIATLLGLFQRTAEAPLAAPAPFKVPAFKTFKNPFLTGGVQVWSPEKLITYTYDALQSWVLEAEAARGSPKTPREFCRQLGEEIPEAAATLEHLAFLYGHVAYGASVPGGYNSDQLRLLWDYMARPKPKPSSAPISDSELATREKL
jgi:hypothetical protein